MSDDSMAETLDSMWRQLVRERDDARARLAAAERALRLWRGYPCTLPCFASEPCRACQTRSMLDATREERSHE